MPPPRSTPVAIRKRTQFQWAVASKLRCSWLQQDADGTLRLIILIALLDMIATGLVVPTIPYYAQRLEMNASMQGLVMSLYGTLQLLGSPLLGRMSDLWGRKVVLIASILGTFASYALLVVAHDAPVLFLSRIIVGLLKNTETSCFAMITDISTPMTRVRRLSYITSAMGAGFILGPALSGLLTSFYSLEAPAYLSTVLLLATAFLTAALLPDTRRIVSSHSNPASPSFNGAQDPSELERNEVRVPIEASVSVEVNTTTMSDELIDELDSPVQVENGYSNGASAMRLPAERDSLDQDRSFNSTTSTSESPSPVWKLFFKGNATARLMWIFFGTSMAFMLFQGSSALLFQSLGIPVQATSWIISYSGLLTVVSSFVIQKLANRFSEHQLLVISIFAVAASLFSAACVLTMLSGDAVLWGLLLVYIPLIMSSRLKKNCLMGLITHQVPSNQTGALIGLLNSVDSFGRASTPLIAGVLMQYLIAAPALVGSFATFAFWFFIQQDSSQKIL